MKDNIKIVMFFLTLQFLIIIDTLIINYTGSLDKFLWFCYHTPLIFAIAFYINNKDIIKALINVGFLSQLIWILDLLSKLILNTHILGLTEYIFTAENKLIYTIPILTHLLSTNIALYLTRKDKPKNKSLIYSFTYLIIIIILTILLTNPNNNINCSQYICGLENITIPFYIYLWPILTFIIIILPTHLLQHIIYKNTNNIILFQIVNKKI